MIKLQEEFEYEIIAARTRKGLTQEDVAKLMDMQLSNYCRIENGRYNANIRLILKLADVLDMKLTFVDK